LRAVAGQGSRLFQPSHSFETAELHEGKDKMG
jgi:hypothetical protein